MVVPGCLQASKMHQSQSGRPPKQSQDLQVSSRGKHLLCFWVWCLEWLDHIFQVCPGMDAARREGQNSLVCQLEMKLVSDTVPLDEVHTSKVQKYDDKDVQIWMTNNKSRWIPSSESLCDCIRLQLKRSDLIEIVLLLERPRLLQKHVNEFVNDSSSWPLSHAETS